MAQNSRPCKGCGEPIYRTAVMGPIAHYHGPQCRARCTVQGCEKPQTSCGMCSPHYGRARRHGDPLTPLHRHPNVGACSVDGCDQPMRKTGMCAGHYAQKRTQGEIKPWRYRWAAEKRCLVCGATEWPGKRRKVCSQSCQQLLSRYAGQVPSEATCVRCGLPIDLTERGKAGRRKRADVRICRPCRRARASVSARGLAARDGATCGICGTEVDMALRAPHLMRPSADHIVPRARGGSDDPSNLQLAHLWCNQVKSDRIDGAA